MSKVVRIVAVLAAIGIQPMVAQDQPMTFFITSVGSGDGANLRGLRGADQHCTSLAAASGAAADIEWRAYLSSIARNGNPAVNARDRIGSGPWYNVQGVRIANNVADLHSENANLTKETILTEKGSTVNGRGDSPNMHDILTGSNPDGTVYVAPESEEGYNNCENWSSNAATGATRVGHHDRQGGGANPTSWNSAHSSRGCGQENLQGTGGNGFFYCFGM